ncbi:MAG: hypothetical protein PUG78_10520 [Eubacteriales bacterium]|nr:hypothetical protein [Eubacteriales bacterium]
MLKISYIIPYDIIIFNVQSCFCSRKSKQLKYIEHPSETEIKEYITGVRMYGRPDSENDLNKVDELLTLSAFSYHVKSRRERFVVAAAGT